MSSDHANFVLIMPKIHHVCMCIFLKITYVNEYCFITLFALLTASNEDESSSGDSCKYYMVIHNY